jgi:RNA polymerase sigma factor (sigma-70 family)
MAGRPSVAVLRDIQTLFDSGTASGLSDRQLVERFSSRREGSSDAAFEALVVRHGPTVLRVCRNLLRDETDVEDAFQATFLVLVRKRDSIRKLESVGGWLYGVACRVAARARFDAARRRRAEDRAALRVVEAIEAAEGDAPLTRDFGPVVQEEVRHLPEKYRAVVVLCYWQSLTHEQAAGQLGCPLGTVRSRLARARKLLHRRLTRRGLAPLAVVVAAALDQSPATTAGLSAVPAALVCRTVRAAAQVACGKAARSVVSGVTASLIEQMVWSMTMIKIKTAVVSLALVGLMGYSATFATQRARESRSEKPAGPDGSQVLLSDAPGAFANLKSQGPGVGTAKSSHGSDFYSSVRSLTSIIKIVSEGSTVKKGQVVCELDSAGLKDQLINQRITVSAAKANYENARIARERAEADQAAYSDDIFPREKKETQAEVTLAKAEMSLAEEQLNAAIAAGANNKLELMRADLAIAQARLAIEKAENRRHVLLTYTSPKQLRTLTSAIESTKSNELAKQATYELETGRVKLLEKQIASCQFIAPFDGIIVYYSQSVNGHPMIEEGAQVRERQRLFRIVPLPGAGSIKP